MAKDIDFALVATSMEWRDPVRGSVSNQQRYIDFGFMRFWANILSDASLEPMQVPIAVMQVNTRIADLGF